MDSEKEKEDELIKKIMLFVCVCVGSILIGIWLASSYDPSRSGSSPSSAQQREIDSILNASPEEVDRMFSDSYGDRLEKELRGQRFSESGARWIRGRLDDEGLTP